MLRKLSPLPACCFALSLGMISACSHQKMNSSEPKVQQGSTLPQEGQIQSHYAPGEITLRCEQVIQQTQHRLAEWVTQNTAVTQGQGSSSDLSPGSQSSVQSRTSPLLEFETVMADLAEKTSPWVFMSNVATDQAVSNEASQCAQKLGDFEIEVYTRRDLYSVLKAQKAHSVDEQRLLSETLKEFEKNGLKLSDESLKTVRAWMQQLNEKEVQFAKNLAQDVSTLGLDASQLQGAPSSFLERLKKDDQGRFLVTTKSTDFTEVMENVSLSDTRKKMLFAYMNRGGKQNTELLEESIELRKKIAHALGFKNWVDYRTQDRMATSAEVVSQFLNQLKASLKKRSQRDLEKLLELKKKEDPSATHLDQWDIPYYAYQLKKAEYHLNDDEIREFFPASHVVKGMFDLYANLLGVRFEEQQGAPAWAEGVKFYHVVDVRGERKGKVIGSFYMDLIPRPLKYGHAAVFSLRKGRRNHAGEYIQPIAAMVANFNPPTHDQPSLLTHSQVVTLFHEFGHIVHQVLTQAPYASLSGTSVARDFVEAPSQMMENWAWSPQVLKNISQHYQKKDQHLPQSLIQALIHSRTFNQGYFYTRQLYFGLLDYSYHTSEEHVQTTPLADQLYRDLLGVDTISGGNFPATFGHLMGGYDAGYYGYLWSEVYSSDLFQEFEKKGLFQAQLGLKYRKWILEPGHMRPGLELIEYFLGRKPNQKAFLKRLKMI